MRFEKGNQAAAKSATSRKAMAAMIRKRLEKEGNNLSNAEFTKLTSTYNALKAKKQRRKKKSEGKPSEFTENQLRVLNDPNLEKRTGYGRECWEWLFRTEAEEHARGIIHCRYSDGSTS